MAAPPTATVKDMSGRWQLNKTLSDNTDPILALQGLSWFTRTALSYATVTLTIKHYTSPSSTSPPTTHIDIAQSLLGGSIAGTTENRTLDHQWRDHTDHIFGTVRGRSRYTTLDTVDAGGNGKEEDEKFLREGWRKEEGEEVVVESVVENLDEGYGWSAVQVWGFADVVVGGGGDGGEGDGRERRYVRRVVCRSKDGGKVERARLVYDYLGKVEEEDFAEEVEY